ncbi:XRE family transcriptional regulator [Streptomyces bathyalis]|uniref:XRE family transcriptional regulator n=1 Tax=Streptomyces bathyalis TaxID=2710756 RepID=A0A7T1TC68_9ACTN|nr:XRE family transcriptional regulator [Streptomyces bathyalis]QPP10289.1 XRE family transcriptional regulator [Streptomyces bathyalis]
MREIDDALERAGQEAFTREPPKSTQARVNFLLKQLKTTQAVASEIGVTPDSVNRYRRGARKNPPAHIADRIDSAVRARWQPRIRNRQQRQAATSTGITIETRAQFGYTAPIGTTDDGRFRRLTVHLPPEYAGRLFDARQQGATDQQMRDIVAEGIQETYFKDGGRRAQDLEVAINNIEYFDVSF